MSVTIKVVGKRYECEMLLKERVTVIVGDSGVGKTVFTKAVGGEYPSYSVNISDSRYIIKVLTRNTWYDVLYSDRQHNTKAIYVIDDEDFMYTKEFAAEYNNIAGSYFMFITRLIAGNEGKSNWNTIAFSAGEIYDFVADGKKHYLKRRKQYNKLENVASVKVDACITEDKCSGKDFAETIFKDVVSAESKDKILAVIRQQKDLFRNKVLFLFIDYSAIGFGLFRITDYCDAIGIRILFSSSILSLEYVLLKSKLFCIEDELIFNDELLNYTTVERRCTDLLIELTRGEQYAYSKKRLNECYVRDCCCKNQTLVPCNRGVSGDKLTALFYGTQFEFLVTLRDNNR